MVQRSQYVVVYTGIETLRLCEGLKSVCKIIVIVFDCNSLTEEDCKCICTIKNNCISEIRGFSLPRCGDAIQYKLDPLEGLHGDLQAEIGFFREVIRLPDNKPVSLNLVRLIIALSVAKENNVNEIYCTVNFKPTEEFVEICKKISDRFGGIEIHIICF